MFLIPAAVITIMRRQADYCHLSVLQIFYTMHGRCWETQIALNLHSFTMLCHVSAQSVRDG